MSSAVSIDEFLQQGRMAGASDLLLVPQHPPCAYINGRLTPISETPLDPKNLDAALREFMSPLQREQLELIGDTDFSYGQSGIGRVRVNIHRQRGTCAATIRFISTTIPTFEQLCLPPKLMELAQLSRGLVLVTGSTGSGKSTTLAAMIEYMNDHFERHIITLEDPIEFLFSHRKCLIEQRQIGEDSPTFESALRHVVRQKPDVILVGEMRDQETIATALTAAETGHLVLATLHTNNATQTIDRVIDVFDPGQQNQIRLQLAGSLRAVVCQTLLRRSDGAGMAPALEILVMTPAIRRAIRDSETHLVPGMIETGAKFGMSLMDHSLAQLVATGVVGLEAARGKASDPERFDKLVGPFRQTGSHVGSAPAVLTKPDSASIELAASGASKPWH
jgi:twitching motility protein PilT